jgi:cell division protein FtsB
VVAVLLVAAMLGAIGTVVGFMRDDNPTVTEQEYRTTIETLTAERSDLVARTTELQATIDSVTTERDGLAAQVTGFDATIDSLTTERDGLAAQVTGFDATVDTLTADLDGITTRVAWLDATIATRTGQRDELAAQVSELDATIDTLTTERDGLVADVVDLESDLAAQTQLTVTAVAERNALAKLFPITFDASLEGVDLVGTYDVELTKAYCEGFATCATLPSVDELTVRKTPQGYLELVIDDFVTAGMFRVDGALYAIADSATAVGACAGTPRVARVAATVYAHGMTVADDGTQQVADLGASLTVQAPATAGCPAGLAFYGAQVTPQA